MKGDEKLLGEPSPKVSIALAAYNGAAYIVEQVESLLSQNYPVHEIIVCDDGSTDETVALLNSFDSDKIKVYRNLENIGYIKNFEKACKLCSGDVIALCDQDDIWDPRKLSVQIKLLLAKQFIAVFSDAILIDEDGADFELPLWRAVMKGDMPENIDFKSFYLSNCVTGCTLIFKKELLEYALPFCDATPHDWWLAYHAAYLRKLGYTEEKLVRYRQHAGNAIGITAVRKNNEKFRHYMLRKFKKYKLNAQVLNYVRARENGTARLRSMLRFESSGGREPTEELLLVKRWIEGGSSELHLPRYLEVFESETPNPVFAFVGQSKLSKRKYVGETVEQGIRRIKRRVFYKYVTGIMYVLAGVCISIAALKFLKTF